MVFTRQKLAREPRPWTDRVRQRLPWKLQEIPADLIVPIAAATLVWFGIRFLRGGEYTLRAFAATFTGSLFTFLLFFFIGRWFGIRWWPDHGSRLARRLLTRYARREHRDLILTGRWDYRPTVNRRLFEAVAFMSAVQVLVILLLTTVIPLRLTFLAQYAVLLMSAYAAVVLVPHWVFGRLGIRSFDKWQFTLLPVTREYSDRLKISNGALLVVVIGVGAFVLRQRGLTEAGAVLSVVESIVGAILFSLITAASAVAFYHRDERRILESVARHAVRMGARDGRGESHAELANRLAEERGPAGWRRSGE